MTKLHHFPTQLKAIRLKKGLTHRNISRQIPCDETLLGHWEQGRSTPSFEKLLRLEEILGDCGLDNLVYGKKKP